MSPAQRLFLVSVAAGLDTAKAVAEYTGAVKGTVTSLLCRLETQGYLKSTSTPEDGMKFQLTAKGKQYITKLLTYRPLPGREA